MQRGLSVSPFSCPTCEVGLADPLAGLGVSLGAQGQQRGPFGQLPSAPTLCQAWGTQMPRPVTLPPGSLQACNRDPEIGALREARFDLGDQRLGGSHPPRLICVEVLMVTEHRQARGAHIPGRCWGNRGCPLRKNPSLTSYGAVIPQRIKELDVGSEENTVHQRQTFIGSSPGQPAYTEETWEKSQTSEINENANQLRARE